ncbi:MAG: hypothetical protein P8Y45_03165 [Exilibacterium sp.]
MSKLINARRQERLVLEVPLSLAKQYSSSEKFWSQKFETAVWLSFPHGLRKNISLHVKYHDKERLKATLIDRCLGKGQTLVLLNGCVKLSVVGDIKAMGLFVKGLEKGDPVKVEECHFKPKPDMLPHSDSIATRKEIYE